MMNLRPFSVSLALSLSLAGIGCTSDTSDPDTKPDTTDCNDPDVAGCVVRSDKQRITTPTVSDADAKELAAGNTGFALSLYQQLRTTPGNLFYSPYSMSSALAMTYAGARNETERQMAKALHFTLPQDRLHPAFNALDLALESRGKGAAGQDGKGFRLNVANALWGQTGYSFERPFLDVLAENYGAGLRLVNFIDKAEEARGIINDWVEERTEDRIKDILPPGSVTPDTRLVLTNAIYFNAAWAVPFEVSSTAPADFKKADGSTVSVPTMAGSLEIGYGEGSNYAAVEMPYDGGELSMVLVLPTDLDAFEAGLDSAGLDGILSSLTSHQVSMTLPKFKFESEFSLAKPLSDLGMPIAFSSDADLSGINGKGGLAISDVLHKAYVSVNEAGTEAAAATAVVVGDTALPTPAEIHFDRSFLFFIRDLQTNAVLFVGRVTDPS